MRLRPLIWLVFIALAIPAYVPAAPGDIQMWGCSRIGERGNILYLAEQGTRSYIKFSGQRITATLTTDESGRRWSWGANAMVLDGEGMVRYLEGDTVKAQFKCRKLE